MLGLRSVAERANVSVIVAYQVLSRSVPVDDQTRKAVLEAAIDLGYTLNVTIRDVAHAADVSIATVSYVLNNSAPVSAVTRQRVLDAATALNYRPNSTARNLKASETRLIGHAWHDVEPGLVNAFLDRFTFWMAHAVESHGYHVLTFVQSAGNPLQAYDDLIWTNRVDGFIISNTNCDDLRISHLLKLGVPFAAFGRANDGWDFPFVDVDGRRGIELVVEHLLAMGHQRIAFIGWPEGSLTGDSRLQGYLDTMAQAVIQPRPEWIARTQNIPGHAYRVTKDLIGLSPVQRPTAIVCVSDVLAVGVMNCLQDAGIRVGIEVAVTGFDDDPSSEFLRPALTSLRQPVDLIAAKVVEMVVAEINQTPAANRQVLLAPTLMVRASSGHPILS